MGLRVYNTLTKKKEEFESVRPGQVGIYLCGPTVYMESHIGHAVGPLIFDMIKRYLEFKGYQVTWVVNITDVDDKIIKRASETGRDQKELAAHVTENYLKNLNRLGVRNIDVMPRATEHIREIVEIVEGLIDKGYAYEVEGDVYFDVEKKEDYGKLSRRRTEELMGGARIAVDERKRNEGDFALWKSAKPGEPSWVSPWGPGRPGWHIECSAMSMKYLGETFDIHGGGVDLVFPHHENEIAQSEGFTGKPFAKYWLHNGLTQTGGEKMSKSLGNLVTISDLLERHRPEIIRFFVLSTHYRNPLGFSEERIKEVDRGLKGFYRLFERLEEACGESPYTTSVDTEEDLVAALEEVELVDGQGRAFADAAVAAAGEFFMAMDDDFNSAGAIGQLFNVQNAANRLLDAAGAEPSELTKALLTWTNKFFAVGGGLLGLFQQKPAPAEAAQEDVQVIEKLIAERNKARASKDFKKADEIRERLRGMKVIIEDRPDGTKWTREE